VLLDLRLPIGLLFTALGLLLLAYGAVSDRALYASSLGVNINLWWGLVILAFGGLMLGAAWRAARRGAKGMRNEE
jgi:hypothetical protein